MLNLNNKRTTVAAMALVVVLSLGGAFLLGRRASDANTPGTTTSATSTMTLASVTDRASATKHNRSDEMFATRMEAHHEQAIIMSKLAAARAGSREVKELATTIEFARRPEMKTMAGWIDSWGTSGDTSGMDHSDSTSMGGMMSQTDMRSLANLRGAAFDKEFLTMMIAHHGGAVTMANKELRTGESADALALAASIVVSQQGQIDQMRAMLS